MFTGSSTLSMLSCHSLSPLLLVTIFVFLSNSYFPLKNKVVIAVSSCQVPVQLEVVAWDLVYLGLRQMGARLIGKGYYQRPEWGEWAGNSPDAGILSPVASPCLIVPIPTFLFSPCSQCGPTSDFF